MTNQSYRTTEVIITISTILFMKINFVPKRLPCIVKTDVPLEYFHKYVTEIMSSVNWNLFLTSMSQK